jgi:predicted permease
MNPGFRLENHLIVEIDPSLAGYGETRGREILQTALDRLRAVPGVESASVAATVPFGMISLGRNIQRASDPPPDATDPARGAHPLSCGFNMVGADYFKTMGIGVLRGRSFLEIETAGGAGASAPGGVGAATPVVIIDKLAADRLWPGGDALGQRIRMLSGEAGRAASEAEVVGVVSSVQQRILGQEQTPLVYVPFGQEYQSDMNIHLKIAPLNRDAEARVVEAVRREIHAVDSRLPVLTLRSLRAHLEASFDIWLVRTAARMFAIFGAVALLLAAVGLYGVRAYAVVRRTREIGIRMAIGASSGDTLRMVLREGLYLTGIGAGVGLALSLVLGRVMAGMLYRVSGADPLVFSAAPLVLGGVSILACYFPARRASRLDPMAALRTE